MIVLKPLTHQALIDLIAPSSSVSKQQIKSAIEQVSSLGFRYRVRVTDGYKNSSTKKNFTEEYQKFALLKMALMAKDSEAIWCIRGGYGSQKLLTLLSRLKTHVQPKLLIGYSDITALQLFLNQKWGWPVLHFPVLTHLNQASLSAIKRFQKIICGGVLKKGSLICQKFKTLKILNSSFLSKKPHSICAPLIGGNMTVIQSMIGTAWAGSFQQKMLFLEDVGEAPYRVDRALWQLQNAGVFKGIKALILGDFLPPRLSDRSLMQDVLQSFSKTIKTFPVVAGVPCGHGPQKEALPFGTQCECFFNYQKKVVDLSIHSPFYSSSLKSSSLKKQGG